jgi:hypothetical protein
LIEGILMATRPKLLTADDFRKIIKEELIAHDERLGRDASTIEKREELRKDAVWTRTQRERMDAIASKTGYILLTAFAGSIIALLAAGMKGLR